MSNRIGFKKRTYFVLAALLSYQEFYSIRRNILSNKKKVSYALDNEVIR